MAHARNQHPNAPLTPTGRRRIVACVLDPGQERKILDLLAEGRTNRQIANELFLAETTVKNYVSNLLSKLGMSRRTEAAVYAARLQARSGHPGSS